MSQAIPANSCRITGVTDSIHDRYLLESHTDAFASIWCELDPSLNAATRILSVRFNDFDSIPISISQVTAESFQLVCKVPPGLDPSVLRLHLRVDGHRASPDFYAALDTPLRFDEGVPVADSSSIRVLSVVDHLSGHLSVWLQEAAPCLSLRTVSVRLCGIDLTIDFLSPSQADGIRQINCRLPRGLSLDGASIETHIEIWNEGRLVVAWPIQLNATASL